MDTDNIQVVVSPEVYMMQIREMEEEIARLKGQLESSQQAKKKKQRREVTPYTNTYSDYKSDGKRKPHPADSIRSYSDFKAIQDYFLNKNDVRDWMMWTIGVSLGLRVSDLLSLRFGHFVDTDRKTIKPRIEIYEKKTGKLNNLLITESVKFAILRYLESIKYKFDFDDFVFASRKTGQRMHEEHGWRILSTAGRAVGLPINIGSHTMRKSFANIAACVDRSCVDMNAITKVQGLLNHSDQRVTMRYLGTYQDMFDRARVAVSDFVLGKTGIDEIVAGNQYTVDDVVGRLDALEEILTSEKEKT